MIPNSDMKLINRIRKFLNFMFHDINVLLRPIMPYIILLLRLIHIPLVICLSIFFLPGLGQLLNALFNGQFRIGMILIGISFLLLLSFSQAAGPYFDTSQTVGSFEETIEVFRQISEKLSQDSPVFSFILYTLFTIVLFYSVYNATIEAYHISFKPRPKRKKEDVNEEK